MPLGRPEQRRPDAVEPHPHEIKMSRKRMERSYQLERILHYLPLLKISKRRKELTI
jgi:hypothetical protein